MQKTLILLLCVMTIAMVLAPGAFAYDRVTRATGLISAIDTAANTVTIAGPSTMKLVLTVVTATTIVKDGSPSTLANLVVGDRAEAAYTIDAAGTKTAVRIAAFTQRPPVLNVKGIISATDAASVSIKNFAGAVTTLAVVNATVITRDGQTATLADLKAGDAAEAGYVKKADGSLEAVRIAAMSPAPIPGAVKGVISAKTDSTVSIAGAGPSATAVVVVLKVTDRTEIRKDGKLCKLGDLKVQDLAEASYLTGADGIKTAVRIAATTPKPPVYLLKGTLDSVNVAEKTVSVKCGPAGSTVPSMLLKVGDQTAIYKNGVKAELSALAAGDLVEASYTVLADGTKLAIYLRAATPAPVYFGVFGAVAAIDLQNGIVSISAMPMSSPVGGPVGPPVAVLNLKVTDDTVIMKGGVKVGLDALMVSDPVTARYTRAADGTLVALSITVVPPMLEGVITSVNTLERNFQVKTPREPRPVVVRPLPECVITKDGQVVGLLALLPGDQVSVDGYMMTVGGPGLYGGPIMARRVIARTPLAPPTPPVK